MAPKEAPVASRAFGGRLKCCEARRPSRIKRRLLCFLRTHNNPASSLHSRWNSMSEASWSLRSSFR
eukprot:11201168-Lingulodinium_polyedra.AAC.1